MVLVTLLERSYPCECSVSIDLETNAVGKIAGQVYQVYVDKDIMVLANPEIPGLPGWVVALMAAGGLAAALVVLVGAPRGPFGRGGTGGCRRNRYRDRGRGRSAGAFPDQKIARDCGLFDSLKDGEKVVTDGGYSGPVITPYDSAVPVFKRGRAVRQRPRIGNTPHDSLLPKKLCSI